MIPIVLFGALLFGQSTSKKPLEGAWKVAEIVITGDGAINVPNAQPGLFIFAQKHYSMFYVSGSQPRTLFKGENATNEEKIAAYDSFVANTGTYEISGSTITIHPMVARNPNFMAGGFDKYQFRIEGNTLWLTEKSTDLNTRNGGKVGPGSGPASETRLKLTRLE
jgi:hypothetical protein